MRNVILGTIGGLIIGTLGAFAYSHFLGDGALAADLQARLDDANSSLASAKKAHKQSSQETSSAADQIDQLTTANSDLQKQVDDLKSSSTAAAQPAPLNPAVVGEMLRGMFRGGGFGGPQRMFLLKTRLQLTADQEAKVKAAMDADQKARRDLMRGWFQTGKIDPAAAAAANTLDPTLKSVLSPMQQSEYQKVQADERDSRAQSMASAQVNNVAPLLQLTDTQRDQAMSAVYQAQASAPDPATLMTDPNAPAAMAAQAQAIQAAVSKVLTPDQLTLYQQQSQMFPQGGFGRPRGGNGTGANGGGNTAGGNTAANPTATPAPATSGSTTPTTTTTGASSTDSSTTAAANTTTSASSNSTGNTTAASTTAATPAPAATQ